MKLFNIFLPFLFILILLFSGCTAGVGQVIQSAQEPYPINYLNARACYADEYCEVNTLKPINSDAINIAGDAVVLGNLEVLGSIGGNYECDVMGWASPEGLPSGEALCHQFEYDNCLFVQKDRESTYLTSTDGSCTGDIQVFQRGRVLVDCSETLGQNEFACGGGQSGAEPYYGDISDFIHNQAVNVVCCRN